MGHKSKNLKMQISDELRKKLNSGVGSSRHADKSAGSDAGKIYSFQTFETYKNALFRFASWMKEKHPEAKNLAAARAFCDEYIRERIAAGLSPYTLKSEVAAFAKLYGQTSADFVETPPRSRAEITRSRHRVKYDRHFSETSPANVALREFCQSCGLRRNELEHLRGSFLIERDGRFFLDFTGARGNFCKGGRPRLVPVVANTALVLQMCRDAGENLVFPVVHHAADVHRWRAEYCRRIYSEALAEMYGSGEIPASDRYRCRGERAGVILSRKCMRVASEALGHSRIDVIASNYLFD